MASCRWRAFHGFRSCVTASLPAGIGVRQSGRALHPLDHAHANSRGHATRQPRPIAGEWVVVHPDGYRACAWIAELILPIGGSIVTAIAF